MERVPDIIEAIFDMAPISRPGLFRNYQRRCLVLRWRKGVCQVSNSVATN